LSSPSVSTVSLGQDRGRPHRPARAIPFPWQDNRARHLAGQDSRSACKVRHARVAT